MKKVKILIFITLFALGLEAKSYITVEEGVELPLKDNTAVYVGAPVEIVKENKESVEAKITGYVDAKDKGILFATSNHKLVLARSDTIKQNGKIAELSVIVPKENITDNAEDAYWTIGDRFYEKCTQCHVAKVVGHHTMLEWEGLYESMREFTKPSEEDTAYILRYLRAFSKDGIVKEAY